MRPGIRIELWRACLVAGFSLLLGISIGYPLQILIVGGVAYMLWTLHTINATFYWIDHGLKGRPPHTSGVWGEITNILKRRKRIDKKRSEKLRETITRIGNLTEALEQGILVLREDLTLDFWNAAAGKQLGLHTRDRGTPIINLIRQPRFIEFIRQREFSKALELPSPTRAGAILSFHGAHFGDNEVVLVVTDVTRLRNLEQLRREFVSNVSHELRTPLTVLQGYVETLQDSVETQSPLAAKALPQMAVQIARMQTLANDLILLAKLESETIDEKPDNIRLKPVLDQIVHEAKQLSGGRHDIVLKCPNDVTLPIKSGDLHSAVGNMVFNAVLHNPKGCDINVEVEQTDTELCIRVRDNGIGIEAEALPRLTERFYRTDISRNSQTGGSGLGLAIVKHVMARYGAKLSISSEPQKGATFSCHFRNAKDGCQYAD